MPWRENVCEYPARSVACSGSPSRVRSQPLWTFGRHAILMLGATLFQSVSNPLVPRFNWMYSGTTPLFCRLKNAHLLNGVVAGPRPDMPHTESNVTAYMVSFTAWNGVCRSHRAPPLIVTVGFTRH